MTPTERGTALLLALLLLFGLARAVSLAWVCDDAFISLRYAQNLVEGHGLVYNPGERVEGYTNLLWTLMLAAQLSAGVDPLRAAEWPGIAAYLWLAAVLAHWSWRRAKQHARPFLPLAAGFVLVSDDFQTWATGGLETMLFTALAAHALVLTRGAEASLRRCGAAGLLLGLLVLTRPDGILFAAAAVLSWWVPRARLAPGPRLRASLATGLPVLLVLGVWIPWKLAYYGEFLPTAFYSKSAAEPYLSQGVAYAALYLAKNWVLVVALLAAAVAWLRSGGERGPDPGLWDGRFFLASGLLYAGHVVYVGGDFMFARRLIPAVPFFLLALEGALARWPAPRPRTAAALATLVGAALPLPLFDTWSRIQNVGDERRFYPAETVAARREQGEAVGRALADTPARVAFEGGMCVFGYYSRLPYLVEITGLTQYSLAKRPIEARGFVGHEKVADDAWLAEHGVHMIVSQELPPLRPDPKRLAVDEIHFGDRASARIVVYSDEVMDPLRERDNVRFTPIERAIALSRARMERASLAEAREIYTGLRRYYLDAAGERGAAWDRELRAVLERREREAPMPDPG